MTGYKGLSLIMLCYWLCSVNTLTAQSLYRISMEEKVSNASLVVEGRVISQLPFWNEDQTMIYTSNRVEIYKIFKGVPEKDTIEIVTLGGSIGLHAVVATHQLELSDGDIGVFFCQSLNKKGRWEAYGSAQGFLKYNLDDNIAAAPFARYDRIEQVLYPLLIQTTGRKIDIRNTRFTLPKFKMPGEKTEEINNAQQSILAPVITSFSPATVNAGALNDPDNNVLTITGSGFGPASGSAAVLFRDANAPPGFFTVTHSDWHIISWSDNQIRIRVPSQAGTGAFRVRDNTGAFVNSPAELQVGYSVLTAFISDLGVYKQFTLADANDNGGYTFKYSTNTANNGVNLNTSPAKATFLRALNTWKETTGLNFIEGGITSTQEVKPNDGENVIMFDNSAKGSDYPNPLGEGVLATCVSGLSICGNSDKQAFKTGFDIVIRNMGYSTGSTPFTFGPCPPYSEASQMVDLETVLLHELGHALNLGHVIDPLQGSAGTANPAGVMHYAMTYNQRRTSLDYSSLQGALFQVSPHGYDYGGCRTEMTPLTPTIIEAGDECPATFPSAATHRFTTVRFDLVHATSNKLTDPRYTQMTVDGTGANITNTAYYALRTAATGGTLSLKIENYITSPEEIVSCPTGVAGIPVAGVKLALYATPSCPQGGSFPTPVAYRTFNANGELPVINGLQGNTTYLLVLDGIQNTKAVFDISFTGSALPERTATLNGAVTSNHNLLEWSIEQPMGITSLILERSADGISYQSIANLTSSLGELGGVFTDLNPFPGENYYRLALENNEGGLEYSGVVQLTRPETLQIITYPNPASGILQVEIRDNEASGTYGASLRNALGQTVLNKQININSNRYIETLTVSGLARGIYFLTIFGKDGKRVQSSSVMLK